MNKFRKTIAILTLAAAFLAAFSTSNIYAATRTSGSGIKGKVTCNGAPSKNAIVEAQSSTGAITQATTNNTGNYVFNLAPGDYNTEVYWMNNCNYFHMWVPVTVYPNTYTIQNFQF